MGSSPLRLFALLLLMTAASATADEVVVQNLKSLLAALGSDRTVILEPGDYHSDETIVVKGLQNLRLVGKDRDATRILVRNDYSDVIRFEDVRGLTLSNLTFGHHPEVAYCVGGVVVITRSAEVKVENSVMFGSGVEGLTLHQVEGFQMERSEIRECTSSVMTVIDSSRVQVSESDFLRSEVWEGQINVVASDVLFDQVTVENLGSNGASDLVLLDQVPYYLDEATLASSSSAEAHVVFRGGRIAGVVNLPDEDEPRVTLEGVDTAGVRSPDDGDSEDGEEGSYEGGDEGEGEGDEGEGEEGSHGSCPELEQVALERGVEVKRLQAELLAASQRIAELEEELARGR